MTQTVLSQLDKVLALVDSNQEGEALGALRMARKMLQREGLSFVDLAQAARRAQFSLTRSLFNSVSQQQWEAKIDQLQDDLQAQMEQNESLTAQVEFWRRRAFELEQMLTINQAETTRWRDMARETAERLWDLGQIAHAEASLKEVSFEADDERENPTPLEKAHSEKRLATG
ncbi:MAG: hypothetical protein EOM37_01760 [Proteobacteria bacterium]|nr:hypothetical protein [Pseudomonadota bacterium]